jgi:DHA1 family bicyclomycin/chloramphenicol resistance-like MFS transporter
VTIVVVVASGAPSWFLAVPLWVAVSSLGLVFGNATALALSAVTRAAGSASAVLGALQFGLGALVSPLVGIGGEHTAVPLAAVMFAASAIAWVSFLLGRGHLRRHGCVTPGSST